MNPEGLEDSSTSSDPAPNSDSSESANEGLRNPQETLEQIVKIMKDCPDQVTDEQRNEMEAKLKAGGRSALKEIFEKALARFPSLYCVTGGGLLESEDTDHDMEEEPSNSENQQQGPTNAESPQTNDGPQTSESAGTASGSVQQQQRPDDRVDKNAGAGDLAVGAAEPEVIVLSDTEEDFDSAPGISAGADEPQIVFEKQGTDVEVVREYFDVSDDDVIIVD